MVLFSNQWFMLLWYLADLKLNTDSWRHWFCVFNLEPRPLYGDILYTYIHRLLCFKPSSFVLDLRELKMELEINVLISTHIYTQSSFLLIDLAFLLEKRKKIHGSVSNCIHLLIQVFLELVPVRLTFCHH